MNHYQAPKNLLQGKVILVTGSSDGIGRTIAKTYAAYGATIILQGRNVERLEKVYDEIIEQGSAKPAIIPFDLKTTDMQQYINFAETVKNEFGQLNGLLLNAAMISELSPIEFTESNTWHEMMQVNINSVFMLTQACLPLLKESPESSIITTSSSVGRKGRSFWGPYAVSKFAVEGFTQVLADELDNTNVRINAINPGATRTKMRATAYPAEDKSKLTSAEEISHCYLYLMGRDSIDMNGQSVDCQPK